MADDRTRNDTSSLPTPPQELHLREEEEQLQVGKRQVQAGEVQLHKTVHTEHQDVPVELAQENVEIERVDLPDGTVSPDAFQEREIEVPFSPGRTDRWHPRPPSVRPPTRVRPRVRADA